MSLAQQFIPLETANENLISAVLDFDGIKHNIRDFKARDAISGIISAVDQKIMFDDHISGISGYDDLVVIKLSADEYAQMLEDGTCLSNAIYIVEAPTLNAFNQRIINVAPGTGLSDAVNLEQLQSVSAGLASDYYKKTETSSASQIQTAINAISTYAGDCLPLSGGMMAGDISFGDAIGVDFNGVQIANGEQGDGFAMYVSGMVKYAFYDIGNTSVPSAMPPQGEDDVNVMRGMDVYAVIGDISTLIHAT